MADSTISTLKDLAGDSAASQYINRIFDNKNNVCLGSLEEAIEGLEGLTKQVENAGDEIKALNDEVNEFLNVNGTTEAVREVASLLRLLGPLIQKISPEKICSASPDQAYESMEDMAIMLFEMAEMRNLGLRSNVRAKLRKSASTLSAVNTFFTYVRLTFEKFDKICTAEKQYNIEAINALGDLMSHMADLYRATGAFDKSDRIRKGKLFTYKLAVQLRKIDLVELGSLDCSRHGDLSAAADTMDDLATLVDEIGLENLEEQLGLDFNIPDFKLVNEL